MKKLTLMYHPLNSAMDSLVKPLSLAFLCALPLAGCMTPWHQKPAPDSPCEVRERDLTRPWSDRFYWCGPKIPIYQAKTNATPTRSATSPVNTVVTYPLHAGETTGQELTPVIHSLANPPKPPAPPEPLPNFVKSSVTALSSKNDSSTQPPESSPLSHAPSDSVIRASGTKGPAQAPLTTWPVSHVVKLSFSGDSPGSTAIHQIDALVPQVRAANRVQLRGLATEKDTPEANDQLSVVRAWSVRQKLVHQGIDERLIRILYRDPTKTGAGVEVMLDAHK